MDNSSIYTKTVAVGIVTYNRKDLLHECLCAIEQQSVKPSSIIIIDNASTDGTDEMLKENGFIDNPSLCYIRMKTNTGGAGGFHRLMEMVYNHEIDNDWIWIMDDDTIPEPQALEKLLAASVKLADGVRFRNKERGERPISFLASSIYGECGEFMNVPNINMAVAKNGYPYWYECLDNNLINIKSATFVSLLINKEAIYKCGLPCKEYFIWGDDIEYTSRLTHYFGDAYLVGTSIAIHKRKGAKALSLDDEENANRIKLYFYKFRNEGINARFYNQKKFVSLRNIYSIFRSLKYIGSQNAIMKIVTTIKGNVASIFQYKKFRKYIVNQIRE